VYDSHGGEKLQVPESLTYQQDTNDSTCILQL